MAGTDTLLSVNCAVVDAKINATQPPVVTVIDVPPKVVDDWLAELSNTAGAGLEVGVPNADAAGRHPKNKKSGEDCRNGETEVTATLTTKAKRRLIDECSGMEVDHAGAASRFGEERTKSAEALLATAGGEPLESAAEPTSIHV